MDKTQYSPALRNAVAFLKGAKIIKTEGEISTKTGFSKGTVSSYLSGNHMPSDNFINKFQQVFKLNLKDYVGDNIPIKNTGSIEWAGTVEERLIILESQNHVLKETLSALFSQVSGKQVSIISAELQSAVSLVSKPRLDELKKKTVF